MEGRERKLTVFPRNTSIKSGSTLLGFMHRAHYYTNCCSTKMTCDVEEVPLPNSRERSHGDITVTRDMKEVILSNSRRPNYFITVTLGMEEVPLLYV
jgi:hypothetical protein